MPLIHRHFTALAVFALIAGCTTGPDFHRPEVATPTAAFITPNANGLPSQTTPTKIDSAWWRIFNDEALNTLEIRGQQSNLDLQVAATRILQSRAQLGIAGAAGLPHVSVSADYARQALSANGLLDKIGANDVPYNLYEGGFDVSWEIDLWGHQHRIEESAKARAQATIFRREGARVALETDIARSYLLLRGVQTQLVIVGQNRDIAERTLELTRSREANGVATRFDAAAATAQLATISALIPRLQQQRDALMNALALLLAEQPRALNAVLNVTPIKSGVPALPGEVPVGLPSELARRRPDILQAEAALHAATADIGVAEADFYPRIELTGSLGLQSLEESKFGNWSSRNFSIGPTLHLPIFEGGRLKSSLALTKARQQEAAIEFQQTVLRAWHEIDNALNAYSAEQWRNNQLKQAFEQNQRAYTFALRRYQEGASTYLTVLIAQRSVLSSQIELDESSTGMAVAMVVLYKALGGGWTDGARVDQAAHSRGAT
ncbi:efflux transporter, outer membrane factor (OMF) lipoprotein, NodT family [Collimonas sp. OK307]|uniref:efflux transporter outer membrane subunit n=1 Tax=Collimonas sp. OK307 TaxID=1801620 RepID=UPI0008E69027|nr:efflux transporter outer membrane subunit [Collimonas sp. OK307]SFI32221.1 efflux transporter, outer membrane factor (OMF) lipoprotein, NodT family [Collimonas sp. OK307]